MAAGNGTPDSDQASRRQFFRAFGRQTAHSAGNLLAGVEALRQSSQEALGDLRPVRQPARSMPSCRPPPRQRHFEARTSSVARQSMSSTNAACPRRPR
jgi:hypothetical protein